MRTLKKALSLVLVLAMVFALAVPGFAADTTKKAADFKDYSKVTNKEAVDVLTAIGVINGNTDGTFGPEGNFTRAQAASIIAHMMLGNGADALTKAATSFSDVPATHWASGYIQYCVNKGILNGYGNGKFGPDDTLTATQWALMLLGALGYNAKNEGIGGNGWEIATTSLAIQAGVASADELTGAFNRDMAAKLAFNTLTATMVQYSSGVSVSTGDGTNVTVAASRSNVAHAANSGYKLPAATANDNLMQFCEQYFSKLTLNTAVAADDFGHAATTWSFKGTSVGTYASNAGLVVTYTAATKAATVAANLKGYTFNLKQTAMFVDGKAEGTTEATASAVDTTAEVAALTGNGRVVEVYATDSKIDRIVVTNAVLAQVTKVNTKAETVTYKTVPGGTTYTTAVGYGHVAANDYVMINLKADTISATAGTSSVYTNTVLDVAPATVVTGAITATTNGQNITVGGTKYTQAASYTSNINVTSAEQDVYLDAYGYVVYCTANTAAGNYMAVTKASWETKDEFGNTVYKVQGVLADGTVATYTVSAAVANTGLYSYTVSNGKYTLTAAKADDSHANYGHEASATTIEKGAVKIGNHYFANDVKFVTVTNAGTANTKATVYTGKQIVTASSKIVYLTTKSVEEDQAGTISTVFVIGGDAATTSKDLVFATSTTATGKTVINGTTYDTYTVYVNGEKKVVPATAAPATANKFNTFTVDANGVYTFAETTSGVVTSKTITAYGNYVNIDSKDYSAADGIVVIDTRADVEEPIESVSAIAATTGTITASAVVDATNSTVSMIFITNVA